MKILIVDDDFSSRKILQKYLSDHGSCDIAVDGKEAVQAFQDALDFGKPYHLVCLDIMMPEMDGQAALQAIRKIEAEHGIHGLDGAKIIMTTALNDSNSIMVAFRGQCEAYLVKPIEKQKLFFKLSQLGIININKSRNWG